MICSAYLLVPMKEGQSWSSFFKRRFLRIVPPMMLFMVFYAVLPLLWGEVNVNTALHRFYTIPFNFPENAGHLWFLFPLLGIYLFIPIISPWLRVATRKQELFFLGLWAVGCCIPYLNRFHGEVWGQCHWNQFHLLYNFCGYLGYIVLAHYIKVHLYWSDAKRRTVGVALLLLGAIWTILSFYVQIVPGTYQETPTVELGWSFCTINVVMESLGAFLLFTTIHGGRNKWVEDISQKSYGMYLIHIFYLGFWFGVVDPLLPVAAAIPALCILTYLSSYATCKILSYLPGSHWLIG